MYTEFIKSDNQLIQLLDWVAFQQRSKGDHYELTYDDLVTLVRSFLKVREGVVFESTVTQSMR